MEEFQHPPSQLYTDKSAFEPPANAPIEAEAQPSRYSQMPETTPPTKEFSQPIPTAEAPSIFFERDGSIDQPIDISVESRPSVENEIQFEHTFPPSDGEDRNQSPASATSDPLVDFFYPDGINDITQATTTMSASLNHNKTERRDESEILTDAPEVVAEDLTTPRTKPAVYVEASSIENEIFDSSAYTTTTPTPNSQQPLQLPQRYSERGAKAARPPLLRLHQSGRDITKRAGLHEGSTTVFVTKRRASGVVGRQGPKRKSMKKKSVVVSVIRTRKFKHSFGRKGSKAERQPKCNSATLWNIMEQKMSASASVSKQVVYSAMLTRFPGRIASVICSNYPFSYLVVTSPVYCEHRKTPITCFAFIQP
ncbi:hypothetical protein GCK32_011497 [Trichostrongylus colubriformis]|uniref:Ground-like domain-containing protein n=1 Tax=Trichostrongylus colubriformis TaxID=6319 RepID=A0AAN8GAM3_TRICO